MPNWTEGREGLTRRELLVVGTGAGAAALLLPLRAGASHHEKAFEISAEARSALESSPYVYVSPLQSDGSESRCHGEVWYFFDRGDVVLATAPDTWKARALGRGLDRARIWVGDYGRVRGIDGPFRKGPSFVAKASKSVDQAAFDRLLAAYGDKYPDEWGKWEPRFRSGWKEGSRVMVRYTPIDA